MAKLTDREIQAICASEIASAIEYDKYEYKESRERSVSYFLGDMKRDTPPEAGRSQAQTSTTADVVEWVLPGLMRVFFGSDRIVDFMPDTPGDEEFADQASDYVNYVFEKDGEGYRVCWDAFHDALVVRKGIIKFWWDDTPIYSTQRFSGLTDDALSMLLQDESIEVLQHSTRQAMIEGAPVALHDLKAKVTKRYGCVKLASVPPEDFGINPSANSVNDARFVYHRVIKTRSDLIEEGYDKDLVESLPRAEDDTSDRDEIRLARDHDLMDVDTAIQDRSTEEIEIYECYLKADVDGDGVAEWVMAVMAGGRTGGKILAWEEWGDPIPFVELDPMRVPHRWMGRSLADSTMDVQQISTVLLRQTLDNIYDTNHQRLAVVEKEILNPDAVINPKFGEAIRLKGNMSASEAIQPVMTPFIGESTYAMLSYLDDIVERRTGVSRSTMALDMEALQNQTATATNAAQSAQYSKVEMIARNFALGGLRDLFRGLLKLIVSHQDVPRMIRLRDQWAAMDPRSWNAEMDVTINTGLGTGSRERDMTMLMQILGIQREVIANFGPDNGMVTIPQFYNTCSKLVEAAGIRNVDLFFTKISQEEVQQRLQAQSEQPDPKMVEAQQKIELEQMKSAASLQMQQQELAARLEFEREKAAADLMASREKAAADLEAARERASMELQLMRDKAAAELQLRREEMQIEAQLTAEANRMNAEVKARQADTNVKRPE